jgi:hypothetical protein
MSDPAAAVDGKSRGKAEVLFERARRVASANQHDYAIELYLSGLDLAPDDLTAHTELRKIALTRKATGGKPIGSLSAMKLKRVGKDLKQNFLNARKLLAHDPGNVNYMEMFGRAAAVLGLPAVVTWIGPMLFRALLEQPKQDGDAFMRLREIYEKAEEWKLAADALSQAAALKPEDSSLQGELRELAAKMAMKQGNYDKGDFRQSIRDKEGQDELLRRDSDIRTAGAMESQIAVARREWEADKSQAGKLSALIQTLTKAGDLKHENEALEILEAEYARTKNYRWQFNANEVKIRQFARGERMLKNIAKQNPDDASAQKELADFRREKAEMELEHFAAAAKAYPTENRFKFEQAKRLFELERWTEAIPLLQQSQNDAKYRDDSRLLLGRSFLAAEFADEAADTLKNVIETYRGGGDDRGKSIHYWYGRSCEEKGDIDEALRAYSQIAQWDFGYRDVQDRIKTLRGRK